MNLEFRNNEIRQCCSDLKTANRKMGVLAANKLFMRLDGLKAAESLSDIDGIPVFRLHRLKGDKKRFVSITVLGKWRLLILPVDELGNPFDLDQLDLKYVYLKTKHIKIFEISEHYKD